MVQAPAWAASTLTVDTLMDTMDSPNDCATGAGSSCSLRDAITQANANGGGNIVFNQMFGTIALGSALPAIAANNVTITGPTSSSDASLGNMVTVDGGNSYQIFAVNSGVTDAAIEYLNIANGYSNSNGGGGAILNRGTLTVSNSTFSQNSTSASDAGGAIVNDGDGASLTVNNSTFSGNSADIGSAIWNGGTLAVTSSTFSGNSAASNGSALYSTGTLTVSNSTFSGNSAAIGWGGAIFSAGATKVVNSTFSGNATADGSGGAIANLGTLTVTDNIFSANSSVSSATYAGAIANSGTVENEGNNVFYSNSGGDAYGFTLSPTDVTGKDPRLAPLGNYGGPTETTILLPGSSAICAGTTTAPTGVTLPSSDQRGYALDSACPSGAADAGAVQTNQHVVNTLNDSSETCNNTTCSLRDALTANSAARGDITFASGLSGTITLSSTLPQITVPTNLLGPGAKAITVSGNNSAAVGSIFNVTNSVAYAFFYGITIAGGNASGSIDNYGGAIRNWGNLAVAYSAFSANAADGDGGAIDNNGTLTVANSTFTNNNAGYGGAIDNNSGTLTVTASSFSSNSASATGSAGAIYAGGSAATVTDSTFSNNSAGFGGAIYSEYSDILEISNSTFSANSSSATDGGGGAMFLSGTETVANNTFSGNLATNSTGGAIYLSAGTLSAANNIFSQNVSTGVGGIYVYSGSIYGSSISDSYNVYDDNTGGDAGGFTLSSTDLTGKNTYLSSLGWYGGPTKTMIPMSGSAALGAGEYQSGESATDQRGAPRPTSGAIDAGSVQISGNPPMIASLTPDSGTTGGGTSVVISGAGFDAPTAVSFGSTPAASYTVTAASGTTPATITAVSPAESAGAVDVTVTNSKGTSATSPSDEFTYLTPAATPSFTPGTGTYTAAQSVTISDATSGTAIYYTTDGSSPTTASTQYSGAISVNSNETINAIAVASGYANSAMASAIYTFTPGFTAGPGGSSSLSVSPGASAGNTATVSVVGTFGFSGAVNLTCKVSTTLTNMTDAPTCSLNPTSVTISGTTPSTSTLTVTTTAATSAENRRKTLFWPSAGGTALALLLAVPRRRKNWLAILGCIALALSIGAVGCSGGGSGNNGGGGNSGTTAGSYTITVTGTSGTTTATVGTIALTVQ